jgi:hypothetical protein
MVKKLFQAVQENSFSFLYFKRVSLQLFGRHGIQSQQKRNSPCNAALEKLNLTRSPGSKRTKSAQQLGQPDGGEQRCASRGKFSGRRWLPLALYPIKIWSM